MIFLLFLPPDYQGMPSKTEAIDKYRYLIDNHLIKFIKSTHENLAIFVGTWQMQKLNLSGFLKVTRLLGVNLDG